MFGENEKISGRQLERMLVLDWVGKAGLLIPGLSGDFADSSFLLRLLFGIVLTFVYVWAVVRLSKQVENDFYGYVCFRLGKMAAVFVALVYWMYSFVNTLLLLRMFVSIAVTFVLPETKGFVLLVIAAAGGIYAAAGGLEVRARFSDALYPIIVYPLILLLLFAVSSVHPGYVIPEQIGSGAGIFGGGMQVFTAFGGIGLFLYLVPGVDDQRRASRAMFRSVSAVLAGLFLLFLLIVGTFGEQGMKALPWPLLTLMSSVEIPGGFLQRWDVIFTVLLLGSLFAAVAAGMYYLGILTEKMSGGRKRKRNLRIPAILVTAAAGACGDYGTALQLYRICNGCVLIPISVLFTFLLLIVGREKETGRRKAG